MTRLVVPLRPVPNQSLQAQLGDQACIITVYQTAFGLFMNLYVGNELIVCGQICENLNRIVRYAYLGFVGDLVFVDTQGSPQEDPVYTGLGSRFLLVYLPPDALPED